MIDPEKFYVRKYRNGDEHEIIELLDLAFDGWPKIDLPCSKLDHWKWKYPDRPIKELIAAVTTYEDKIIGCLHSPYLYLKVMDKVHFCENGGDLAVHPDFRGMKVWRNMLNKWNTEKWAPSIVGYSNSSHPSVVNRAKSHNAVGLPSPVKHYCRIKDIDEFLKVKDIPNLMVKKMGYLGLSGLSKLRNLVKNKQTREYSIHTISEFDERIDAFWNRIKDDYDIIVVRDQEYLNWRYCDPRGGNYTVRLVEEDGEILGFSVLRTNHFNPVYPEGYIIDLVVLKKHTAVAEMLIQDACTYFDENKVNAVHYWAPGNHFTSKLIDEYGFLDSRTEVYIWFGDSGIQEIRDEIRTVAKDRVLFQLGDVDWI